MNKKSLKESTAIVTVLNEGPAVVTLLGNKGGSGKSTTVINIGKEASRRGLTVVILDVDPQASVAAWADTHNEIGDNFVVQSVVAARLTKTIEAAKEAGADLILIDTAAKSSDDALIAARASDLVIIPSRPSILDLRGISNSVDVAKLANATDHTHILLNACGHVSESDEAEEAAKAQYGLQIAPVRVKEYVAFRHAMAAGTDAIGFAKASKAAAQVRELTDWVLGQVGKNNK